MASSSSSSALSMIKLLCVGLLGLLVLAPHAEAVIGCGQVYGSLATCLGYLRGGQLSPSCCPAIRNLYSQVRTKPDRQSVCVCLKSLANSFKSSLGKAGALLKICGVSLPYPLNPNIDCSKVNKA